MNKFLILVIFLFLSISSVFGQGDNDPDPMVNLGCLEEAVLSGSIAEGEGRGIPSDILWDPSTNDFLTPSTWHEYGMSYDSISGEVSEDDPVWWAVEWPTAKNVNYITVTGPFGNQPQPTTGWSIQMWNDATESWENIAKADNGWEADTLRGTGGWVDDGLLLWRGMQPVVTKGIRFTAYPHPDSLADDHESYADSLWSWVWVGRQMGATYPKACLIQYLDFSEEGPDNVREDEMVNLALLNEAVVSASFVAGEIDNIRGTPTDLLFDPVKGDFNNTQTPWGEFGYPWQYDAGYLTYEEAFYWMVEWPVPKNVNYFTWGGVYGNQPQPDTPWAVEFWDGAEWVTLDEGIGGSYEDGVNGVDTDAESVWMAENPIQTTKFRLAVWSDGITPLFSYHIRGRGGSTLNWDERSDTSFKAILLQYVDVSAMSLESHDFVELNKFALHQNYPNPFNPETNIQFVLPKAGHVKLTVYNVVGQEVAVLVNENRVGGLHKVTFDASRLSSGVYYYRIKSDAGTLTKKMMVIK